MQFGRENINSKLLTKADEEKIKIQKQDCHRSNLRKRIPVGIVFLLTILAVIYLGTFASIIPHKIVPMLVFILLGTMAIIIYRFDTGDESLIHFTEDTGVDIGGLVLLSLPMIKYIYILVSDISTGIHYGVLGFIFVEIIWKLIKAVLLVICNFLGGFMWASSWNYNSFLLAILDPLIIAFFSSLFDDKDIFWFLIVIVAINFFVSILFLFAN